MFNGDDQLAGLRQHAAGHRDAGAAAAVRRADLRVGEQRVRVPAVPRRSPTAWSSRDNSFSRVDVVADAARAAVAADVPVGQHQRRLPHDLLLAQRRRDAARSSTIRYLRQYLTLRSDVVGPVFTRSGTCRGRLRRADEARHRAGVHRRLHEPDRRLHADAGRGSDVVRLRRRRRDRE